MHEWITFTREELYELVWATPMARLATEYAISDVGLAKLCARHDVPTPPRGYWAQREAGKAPKRPPLPPSEDHAPIQLARVEETDDPEEGELARALAALKRPEHRVAVADRLTSPCALVKEARAALEEATPDAWGILEPRRRCLGVRVSRGARARALRIADALLKAFAEHGWPVTITDRATVVELREVSIGLSIEEILETVEVAVEPDLRADRYAFHYARRQTAHKPSGRLCVHIEVHEELWGAALQRRWRDSATRALEDRLELVLVGMLKLAYGVRAERARRRRREDEERERARQRRAELEEQQRRRAALAAERARVARLRDQATRWRESQHLRRFVDEARERGALPELGLDGHELASWIAWALQQADRLDPFAPSPPSILDDAEAIDATADPRRGYP